MNNKNIVISALLGLFLCFLNLPVFGCDGEDPPSAVNTPSPLIRAIKSGNLEAVKKGLDRKWDVNFEQQFKYPYGDGHFTTKTPLFYAIETGQPEVAALLLKNGALPKSSYHFDLMFRFNLNSPEIESMEKGLYPTELLYALVHNRSKIVELLLQHNIELPELFRERILALILNNGFSGLLEPLIKYDQIGDYNSREIYLLLDKIAGKGFTGDVRQLFEKVDRSAYFEQKDEFSLKPAIGSGQLKLVQFLDQHYREYLAEKDFSVLLSRYSENSLREAASSGFIEIFKYLSLRGGFSSDRELPLMESCFVEASRAGRIDMVKYLSEQNDFGVEVLDRALLAGAQIYNHRVMELLLSLGARVDAVDSGGVTPLMISVRKKLKSNVDFLLGRGADPDRKNNSGGTALSYARQTRDFAIIRLVNVKSKKLQRASVFSIEYSSVLDKEHMPLAMFDGNPRTAWVEGASGPGAGNFVIIKLDQKVYFNKLVFRDSSPVEGKTMNSIRSLAVQFRSNYKESREVQREGDKKSVTFSQVQFKDTIKLFIHQLDIPLAGSMCGISELEFYLDQKKINLSAASRVTQLDYSKNNDQPVIRKEFGRYINGPGKNSGIRQEERLNLFEFAVAYTRYPQAVFFNRDNLGRFRWQIDIGGYSQEEGAAYFPVDDGYIFLVNTHSYGYGGYDILFLKLDFDGQIRDQKVFSTRSNFKLLKAVRLSADQYLLIGETENSRKKNDLLFLSVDSAGALGWQKRVPGNSGGKPVDFGKFSPGSYVFLAGEKLYGFDSAGKFYFVKHITGAQQLCRSGPGEIKVAGTVDNTLYVTAFQFKKNLLNMSFLQYPINQLIHIPSALGIDTDHMDAMREPMQSGVKDFFIDNRGKMHLLFFIWISFGPNDNWMDDFAVTLNEAEGHRGRRVFTVTDVKDRAVDARIVPARQLEIIPRITIYGNYAPLSFAGKRVSCNDNQVRVRAQPELSAEIRGHLNKGDSVKVLDVTNETRLIGPMEAPWYKIEMPDGITGWVYGYFLGEKEQQWAEVK